MDLPFRELVETEEWLAEVATWVAARIGEHGRTVTGPPDQRRVRPWSTQVVVPTDHGPAWFKANNPHLAHEAAVHAALAELLPDHVDRPLGVDAERGWLLTEDRGATLGGLDGLTLADLTGVLDLVGDLQRRLVGHGDELLAAGLPDCRPSTVPARHDLLLAALSELPGDHPSHLSTEDVRGMRAFGTEVAEAAARLDASPLDCTLQHGDAHPGNVFAGDSGLRLFDFGDAQWAHPLETLAVPWAIARHVGLDWQPAEAAYAAHWSDLVDPPTFRSLWRDAMVTHDVNRAFLWWHAVEGARPDEMAEWGGMAAERMRSAMERLDPDD